MDKFVLINQVYHHLPFTDSFAVHRGKVTILTTPMPIEGCQAYLHLNADSFIGRLPGLNMLFLTEPIIVLPGHYDPLVWQHFDYIFTHYDKIIEMNPTKFKKALSPRTGLNIFPPITEDLWERESKYPLENRLKALCMVNGNKRSVVPGELYSKRLEIALWFHLYGSLPFDVYGTPPFPIPNFKGTLAKEIRFKTIASYKYYLCFENIHHPVYSLGYADKIYDCLETRTLPIYLGTPDIENYVPRECFIDFREFKNFRELNDFLENMDAQTYQTYIEHIDKWVGQGGLRPLSMHAIHEQIVEILALEKNILASDLYQGSQNWTPGVAAELTELRWNPVIGKAFWTYEYLSQARSPLIDYQKEHFDLLSSNRQYLKKIDQLRLKNKLLEASREFENLFCNGIFTSDLVYQHAQLLTDLSHFKESQEKLQQVLLMKPNHSLALNDLGGLFMLQKDYAKAVEYFHSALSFDVRNDQALENLLSLLLSLNFKDYIAELIQKLLPLRSGDGDFLAILKKYNLSIDPENRKLSDELNPIPAVGGSPGHGIY